MSALDIPTAARRALLGESIASIAIEYRQQLLDSVGLAADEATPTTFRKETLRFTGKLCRHLAEKRPGDARVETALSDWAMQCDDYDAFDALLATFRDFDGRDQLMRKGRALFPRPLTAHWDDES